ncbi:ATP synthase subunit delta, mitochondrial [Strongylocentrotus purpuratus]|uniref:ATP synthase F(1) complex subunit delta, mitochondrial n=1 Tax=Strongylocentrotus purpuratus TaxID=7668 RepID=A0A7M7RHQ1_STRPU|nr:ATP synthase subunit delta, mitochondrial [Strongylocentrotus purpuratus]|eukprot:XP_801793.1 PREDICTED: ATP synthase subunit delta, mitochondrial [Strongylocentrotus purpuratus]
MSLVRNFTRLTAGLRSQRHVVRICQPCRNYAEDAKASAPTQMSFSFGYPGKMFYSNASVKQVDVPSGTGSFGILAQHVPSLAVMKPGMIFVTEDDGSINKYFVSSGMITVNDDSSVQILAEMAAPVEDLDPQAIKEGMTKAQQELAAAATDLARAEAQIAVEVHEAMDTAVNK